MKQYLTLVATILIIIACHSTKKTSNMDNTSVAVNPNMKANLLDGTWEANYIMNTPKPFTELYANARPSITFNAATGQVSGMSGCNNFTGKFSMDGNKIRFADDMALTRKMCPDMAGEATFMETLKKVTSYSVTEQGKTLNLILGDMAIMRLVRK